MEKCVNEDSGDDEPSDIGDPTEPDNGDSTEPDNGDSTPINPGVEIPESCRAIGITDESDRAYIDLVAYNQLRLRIHNEKRRLHQNTPDLEFDLDIACQAQYWALEHAKRVQELAGTSVDGGDRLVHYNELDLTPLNPRQGENLAWRWRAPALGANEDWEEEGWYDREEPNYNYATGGSNGGVIGHFTQMVWDDTSKLGCGISKTDEALTIRGRDWNGESEYSVCRYVTPGNWRG